MESMMSDHKGLWIMLNQNSLEFDNPCPNPLEENNASSTREEDPPHQGPKRQFQSMEPEQPPSKKRRRQRPKRYDTN